MASAYRFLIALLAAAALASAHTRLAARAKANSTLGAKGCPCRAPKLHCNPDPVNPCAQNPNYLGDDALDGQASGFRQTASAADEGDGGCDCGTDEDEEEIDPPPSIEKPGHSIESSFDPIQAWIDYYEEKDAADAVSQAARKAKAITDQIKRSQHRQEMALRDENEMIRMSVQGGLGTILAKEQRRKQAEQDAQDEQDEKNRMLRKASEEIEKVKRRAANVGPPAKTDASVPEQAQDIINNAEGLSKTPSNEAAFKYLKEMISSAVKDAVAKAGKSKGKL